MKSYGIPLLSLSFITSFGSLFGLTFENATDYPVTLTIKVNNDQGSFLKKDIRTEVRELSISAHGHLFVQLVPGDSVEIIDMAMVKKGTKEAIDFKTLVSQSHMRWRMTHHTLHSEPVLTVIPLGTSYKLVVFVQ